MIPDDSVQVNLGHATASMILTNFAIPDYHDFVSFANNGPSLPGMVTFDVEWSGGSQRVHDVNPAQGYTADLTYDTATVVWSGQQGTFSFVSDPANTSVSQFAAIGRERNGRFFPQGG